MALIEPMQGSDRGRAAALALGEAMTPFGLDLGRESPLMEISRMPIPTLVAFLADPTLNHKSFEVSALSASSRIQVAQPTLTIHLINNIVVLL